MTRFIARPLALVSLLPLALTACAPSNDEPSGGSPSDVAGGGAGNDNAGDVGVAPTGNPELDRGIATYQAGMYDEAVAILQGVLADQPVDSISALAHYYLGRSLHRLARYTEARTEYLAVVTDHPADEKADDAQHRIAETYYDEGNYPMAISEGQKVLDLYPGSDAADDAQYRIARSLHQQALYLDARAAYALVITDYPEASSDPADSPGLKDDAQYRIAETHYDENTYATAITEAQKVLAQYAGSSSADDAQYLIGLAYQQQALDKEGAAPGTGAGDFAAAITAYEAVIADYPTSGQVDDAQYAIGDTLYDQGLYQEAITALEVVMTDMLMSADDAAQYRIARCYHRLLDWPRARMEYEKVIANFPTSSYVDNAQYRIGLTYHDEGNCTAEATALEALDPASSLVASAQPHLDEINDADPLTHPCM